MLVGILTQSVLALSLIGVGWWGWLRAAGLVPASLEAVARDRRIAAVRRGAVACLVLGAVFALEMIPADAWHALAGGRLWLGAMRRSPSGGSRPPPARGSPRPACGGCASRAT